MCSANQPKFISRFKLNKPIQQGILNEIPILEIIWQQNTKKKKPLFETSFTYFFKSDSTSPDSEKSAGSTKESSSGMRDGSQHTKYMSPSRSPPLIISGSGLSPCWGNTTQSTKWESSGRSPTASTTRISTFQRNFHEISLPPGCKHGERVITTLPFKHPYRLKLTYI